MPEISAPPVVPAALEAPEPTKTVFGAGYVRYMLGALLVVGILNLFDRQVINVLAEPIRQELSLSDTQLGLLTGLAFALCYNLVGIPLGRYADNTKSNRVTIISMSLALWSAMTALCGLAQNYFHLLAARIGVALGEAGCAPPAHSLIADTVPMSGRARALAIFGLGVPIGALLGKAMGGVLNDAFGWRAAFMIVGLPGIVLAGLLMLTLRDPRQIGHVGISRPANVPLIEVINEVRKSKAIVNLVFAVAISNLLVTGGSVWGMIHFLRNHHLSTGTAGIWIGLSGGVAGTIGTLLGGWLADRWGPKNPARYMTAPIFGMVATVPFLVLGWQSQSWMLAIFLIFLPDLFDNLYYGGAYAALQGLVSERTRATATATMFFITTLVGTGFGALTFGMASDVLQNWMNEGDSVRWVLTGAAFLYLGPAWLYWRASKHLPGEFAARSK